MIVIKSKREIDIMREAGRIVSLTHEELKKHIKPGISTKKLDDIAFEFIVKNGGTPSFKGYHGFPRSICTSVNEVVVHGIPSEDVILKEGDIITIDVGVKYNGYHGDGAWTFPVGKISEDDELLLDITLKSLYKGLELAKPGNYIGDISNAIESFVKPYGYGIVEEFTGHGIGQNLHEGPYVPNFGDKKTGPILKTGMTICVEPMINKGTKRVSILRDNWTTITDDRAKSAHYEHMIAITEDGYEILTKL